MIKSTLEWTGVATLMVLLYFATDRGGWFDQMFGAHMWLNVFIAATGTAFLFCVAWLAARFLAQRFGPRSQ